MRINHPPSYIQYMLYIFLYVHRSIWRSLSLSLPLSTHLSISLFQFNNVSIFSTHRPPHQSIKPSLSLYLCQHLSLYPLMQITYSCILLIEMFQKFELKRNRLVLQLMGNPAEEELHKSTLAAKLNSFSAELCPPKIQYQIQNKIDEIMRKGWPLIREL